MKLGGVFEKRKFFYPAKEERTATEVYRGLTKKNNFATIPILNSSWCEKIRDFSPAAANFLGYLLAF